MWSVERPRGSQATLEERQPEAVAPVDADRSAEVPSRAAVAGRLLGPILILVVYAILILTSTTTSSLGVGFLRAEPTAAHDDFRGAPRNVRIDEWLTQTPLDLGFMAAGGGTGTSPLSQRADLIFQLPTHGGPDQLVFFDGWALRLAPVLPDGMVFAAYWWLPAVLLAMALPVWLRRMGANAPMSWLGTALVLLAPSTAWWSMFPIRIMGFAVAGAVLAIWSVDRMRMGRRLQAVVLAVGSGVLLARMPTFYVPWAITLAVPIAVATFAMLLWPRAGRRQAVIASAVVAASALVLAGAVFWQNRSALSAELGTVYPGLRRTGAAYTDAAMLFGAPGLGPLQAGARIIGTNASEISTAYTVCAAWAAILLAAMAIWGRASLGKLERGRRAGLAVLCGFTLLWLFWCGVSLTGLTVHLPLANRVVPERAAQTVGFLAALVLAIVASQLPRTTRVLLPLVAAATCGLLTLWGTLSLRDYLPGIGAWATALPPLVVAAVVFAVTARPHRWEPVVIAVACAVVPVVAANPLMHGLGDLRGTPATAAVAALGTQARDSGQYWASDSTSVDALLISSGVPSLSGHQVTGPVDPQWRKLDPQQRFRPAWNRGASYLEIRWTAHRPQASVADTSIAVGNSADQIVVSVDPCVLRPAGLPVEGVIASRPLTSPCLAAHGTFRWAGVVRYVYTLKGS